MVFENKRIKVILITSKLQGITMKYRNPLLGNDLKTSSGKKANVWKRLCKYAIVSRTAGIAVFCEVHGKVIKQEAHVITRD
jgi:hypothetical protein